MSSLLVTGSSKYIDITKGTLLINGEIVNVTEDFRITDDQLVGAPGTYGDYYIYIRPNRKIMEAYYESNWEYVIRSVAADDPAPPEYADEFCIGYVQKRLVSGNTVLTAMPLNRGARLIAGKDISDDSIEERHLHPDLDLGVSSEPTGPAGGVLSGTYPNPGFAVDMATQAELNTLSSQKADNVHTHVIGDVTNLQTTLDAKQPLDSELTALAGLTSAANKLPYFTGSGTASLADLTAGGRALINSAGTANTFPYFSASNTVTLGSITAFARTILDDADAGTVRGTIGAAASSHTHAQADITNLVSDLAAKSPLASPTFTGTPAAPTAAAATNTTQIATTAYVKSQAGVAFPALSHTHAQADITNLVSDLAAKAPLASPALTGTPTAPTAAIGTNSTQIASTAFVKSVAASRTYIPSQVAYEDEANNFTLHNVFSDRKMTLSNFNPDYRWKWGGSTDVDWKKIADVSLPASTYSGATFLVEVIDGNTNYGSGLPSNHVFRMHATRSGAVIDDIDSGAVSGPTADYARLVKTATGAYEIQVRQRDSWRNMEVTCRAITVAGSVSITYADSPVNGSTVGTIYTAAASNVAQHTDYFGRVSTRGIDVYAEGTNAANKIRFYSGTTQVGDIGVQDTTWLRINQDTNKNIYTPRYIRADAGLFVDGTTLGIDANGRLMDGSLTGTYTNQITFSGGIAGLPDADATGEAVHFGQLSGYAFTGTAIAISDVTSLQATLDGKAASSHSHAQSDITNLVSDLAGKQPLDTDLTAIAGLVSAANKVPYATGVGTWALADFSAAGRALVDDADAAAQRTTLGLGSLSTASSINNANWSGTDLAVANGGTGASDAATARTNLGAAAASHTHPISDITSLQTTLDGKVDESLIDAKGDLVVGTAADTVARLPVGTNGYVLLADSAEATGMKWAALSGGGDMLKATYDPDLDGIIAVAQGGTGSATASGARTNLGLGSLATASSINDANWSGTDLAIVNGGTGASDASTARTNLGVDAAGTNNEPSGTIKMYGGTAAPSGYLMCDGTAYSRTTYATLFGIIGTAYGAGDGSTTFNVPNFTDKFPKGKGAEALGTTGGSTTIVTGNLPAHSHTLTSATVTGAPSLTGGITSSGTHAATIAGGITSSGSTTTGAGTSHSHGSTALTVTGTTQTEASHTHNEFIPYGARSDLSTGGSATAVTGYAGGIPTSAGTAHAHGVGTLNVGGTTDNESAHTHSVPNHTHTHNITATVANHTHTHNLAVGLGTLDVDGTTDNTGSGTDYWQPYVSVNYIIKT